METDGKDCRMKSILVVSNEAETYPLIASAYKSGFTVERTAGKDAALELLQKMFSTTRTPKKITKNPSNLSGSYIRL